METKKYDKNVESFKKYERNANKGIPKVENQTMDGILKTIVDIPKRVQMAGPIGKPSVKKLAKDEVPANKEEHLE